MKVTDSSIIEASENSDSMKSAAKSLGLAYNTFIYRAKKLGCYAPNQGLKGSRKPKEGIPLEEILNGDHPTYKTTRLKERLIAENYLKEECSECGIGNKWNGKQLVLQLDHIDGDSSNHKLENLRILCPNCHTQTETWGTPNRNLLKEARLAELVDAQR